MGWLKNLFSSPSSSNEQALVVNLPGATIIDLRPLPPDPERVLHSLGQIAKNLAKRPEPLQVFIASARLLEAYNGKTDEMMTLSQALFAASKRVQPKMLVEESSPLATVYLLRSLGFDLYVRELKLTFAEPDGKTNEVDVLEHIEKIRRADQRA
jgi:hypothetical protein